MLSIAKTSEYVPADKGWLDDQIKSRQLGLINNGQLSPCAISLQPYTLTQAQWQQAWLTSQAFAELFKRVSENEPWLTQQIKMLKSTNSLAYRLLLAKMNNKDQQLAEGMPIIRHDLILDENEQWSLVESNSIAAGMGPFSEQLLGLHKSLAPGYEYLPNPAIQRQGQALYQAAKAVSTSTDVIVVFVIQENEDNRFDQQFLAQEIERSGGRVVFKTLLSLQRQTVRRPNGELFLAGVGKVNLIYFRSGYNLEDYQRNQHECESLLAFRAQLESCRLLVCPSIYQQLSTSKWVQMRLSQMDIQTLQDTFQLSSQQAQLVHAALVPSMPAVDKENQLAELLQSGQWLLKTQVEGGGSVHSTWSDEQSLLGDEILMRKISAKCREETVDYYHRGFHTIETGAISEFGVFTVGNECQYGGYLLRTKAAEKLEAGVHRGQGLLDVVAVEKPTL